MLLINFKMSTIFIIHSNSSLPFNFNLDSRNLYSRSNDNIENVIRDFPAIWSHNFWIENIKLLEGERKRSGGAGGEVLQSLRYGVLYGVFITVKQQCAILIRYRKNSQKVRTTKSKPEQQPQSVPVENISYKGRRIEPGSNILEIQQGTRSK